MPITVEFDTGDVEDDPDAMSSVLEQLASVDSDFNFASMRTQWARRGALSPKQAGLMIWRLRVCGVVHNPATLGLRVSTRDSDRVQIAAMATWQREQLFPYLNPGQKDELGF